MTEHDCGKTVCGGCGELVHDDELVDCGDREVCVWCADEEEADAVAAGGQLRESEAVGEADFSGWRG